MVVDIFNPDTRRQKQADLRESEASQGYIANPCLKNRFPACKPTLTVHTNPCSSSTPLAASRGSGVRPDFVRCVESTFGFSGSFGLSLTSHLEDRPPALALAPVVTLQALKCCYSNHAGDSFNGNPVVLVGVEAMVRVRTPEGNGRRRRKGAQHWAHWLQDPSEVISRQTSPYKMQFEDRNEDNLVMSSLGMCPHTASMTMVLSLWGVTPMCVK